MCSSSSSRFTRLRRWRCGPHGLITHLSLELEIFIFGSGTIHSEWKPRRVTQSHPTIMGDHLGLDRVSEHTHNALVHNHLLATLDLDIEPTNTGGHELGIFRVATLEHFELNILFRPTIIISRRDHFIHFNLFRGNLRAEFLSS